jgi:hypothetical protein
MEWHPSCERFVSPIKSDGEYIMLRILLAATMAFGLMPGVVFAQSSTSSNSTTVTTPGTAPTQQDDITSTTKRTATRNGVLIEKDTSGTETSTPGTPATSQTSTQTTSTHQ